MGLSKRFKRALDRENIAISLNQDRNKRVIRKAFEQSSGNTITDTVVSLVKKGLRAQRKDDRAYREDEPESWKGHLKDGENMTKGKLRDFIKEHFDVPKDKNLEDKSKAFLQGYLSIRLQGKGVDIALNEMDEIDLNYIVGLLEGSDSKADTARLVNDRARSKREDDIEELREQRLQIGDSKDDKSVKGLREEREKLYDGIDERVERMVKDKVDEGKDEVTALREARFELFSEGG